MIPLFNWTLNYRWTVLSFFALVAGLGAYALGQLPIDAVPEITPVQVLINTKTGALDPEQIEKTVTLPIETEMSGIANVKAVRSLSKYGLSQVIVTFEEGTDIYWSRQQVSERLQGITREIASGLSPQLGPIATGLSEIVMYTLVPKAGSPLAAQPEKERLLQLRTAQDFVVAPYLKRSVKNIAEVDSTGGLKKEVHIEIHPERLDAFGLSIEDLAERLQNVGENVGGGTIQPKGRQVIVRASGRLSQLSEVASLPVKLDVQGRAVALSQVADVREDFAPRMGGATVGGEEAVLGTVMMLSGANSRQVALDAVAALKEAPLPDDMEVRLLYTRSYLVDATLKTVIKSLVEGAVLVIVVLLLVIGNVRAALLVSLAIPLSMLFGAIGMKLFGISASLMSLGAIDFGLLVDGAVVMIENTLRRMEEHEGPLSPEGKLALVGEAAGEVVQPVTLGLAIIMLVYLPILTLEGIEGKLYHPMAMTVAMALGASLLVAVLLMPVVAFLFLKGPTHHKNSETKFFALLKRGYEPMVTWVLGGRSWLVAASLVLIVAAGIVFHRMGADFMPPLDEGDLVVNLTRASDIGVDASLAMQKISDRVIGAFPEVEHVFARIGTQEAATDPMGVHLSDTFVILKKDRSTWPAAANGKRRTKAELYDALKAEMTAKAPEQEMNANQPIEMRFSEILEGSRADVTLRIYGKDLPMLMGLLEQSIEILKKVPGAEEVEMDALTALRKSPVLTARPHYAAIARYGLDIRRVSQLLEVAMGGKEVGSFYDEQWRFPIVLRVDEAHRDEMASIRSLPVGLPEGGTIPLSSVVNFTLQEEVTTIAHEYSQRYAAVAIFLGDRDIGSFVKEARAAVASGLKLPPGYRLEWGGQFKNMERAGKRLGVIVPVVLAGIFLILWRAFGVLRQAALVFTTIPLAMTGGVFALALRGIPMSVSASVGFIALMGIAILNGMVLVTFFNQLREKGRTPEEAAREGALVRLRPVVMTALVAGLGFVPMALNTGIGADVQRPLATVVIGGLVSATFLTLLLLPALYSWVERRSALSQHEPWTIINSRCPKP